MHNNVNSHVAVCNFENVNFDVIDGLLLSSTPANSKFHFIKQQIAQREFLHTSGVDIATQNKTTKERPL